MFVRLRHDGEKLSNFLNSTKISFANPWTVTKDDYTWEVTVNFEQELSPDDIRDHWTKIARKLRERGIVALWV